MAEPTETEEKSWIIEHQDRVVSILSALTAMVAVGVSIWHYNATEGQRRLENDRERRETFLQTLQDMVAGEGTAYQVVEEYSHSDNLGGIQLSVKMQLLMLFLQAEHMLPDMQRLHAVSEPEYLVLGEHALYQGFDDKAEIYWKKAIDSKNPKVKAQAQVLEGSVTYARGKPGHARKAFERALRTYEESSTLLEQEQVWGQVQICITWSMYELNFGGDSGQIKTEAIVTDGRNYAAKLHPGPIKDSAKRFFDLRMKEIEEHRANPPPKKDEEEKEKELDGESANNVIPLN